MLKKLIVPAMLTLAVLGTVASPADARSRRGRRSSYYRRADDWGGSRSRVARRTERLYRSGRLSRSHYHRTMYKLDRGGNPRAVNRTLSKWSRSYR